MGSHYDPHGQATSAFVVRALRDDYDCGSEHAEGSLHEYSSSPTLSAYAAAAGPGTPTTVKEMEAHPLYEGPLGWAADLRREVQNNFVPSSACVPMSNYHRDRERYGPGRVVLGYIVAAFRQKMDAGGRFAKCRARITFADKADPAAADAPSKHAYYSGCAASSTNRIVTQVALQIGADQSSDDVSGAYWKGTVPPIEHPDGRLIYAHVPKWLNKYSDGRYPTHDVHGNRNVICIFGPIPGRRDSGVIWMHTLDAFLLRFGLRPCSFDPRCFYMDTPSEGALILHCHVDDTRETYTGPVIDRFRAEWAAEFNEELTPLGDTDFTGLRHTYRVDPLTGTRCCDITCSAVIDSLAEILKAHPLPPGYSCAAPLGKDALAELQRAVVDMGPVDPMRLKAARSILGTIGFIATTVRADAYFPFVALARYVNEQRLSPKAWTELLRLGHYLVSSRDLPLTLRHVADGTEMEVWVDSSMGNGPRGTSYGGYHARFPSSGALIWSSSAPPNSADSSGVCELFQGVHAIKAATGVRVLLRELHYPPKRPTVTHTDSTVLIDGTASSKVSKESKWVCTRLAMAKNYHTNGTGRFKHVAGMDNPADIQTKSVVGEPFFRHRASLLGHAAYAPQPASGDPELATPKPIVLPPR